MAACQVGPERKEKSVYTSSLIGSTACSISILRIPFPLYGKILLPLIPCMLILLALPTLIRLYHLYCIPKSFFQQLFQCGLCCYEAPIGGKTGEHERDKNEVKKETSSVSHEPAQVELDHRLELARLMSQWDRTCRYKLVKEGSSSLEPEFVSRHRISLALKAWEQ